MKDLLTIIEVEWRTLLRGLTISFLIIFPFTFLPTLISNGWTIQTILLRIPDSAIYSFGFALVVVIAAIIHNYNNLIDRKRIFDKPAFKKLDFYGRIDGQDSIVRELETFLLGKIDKYYYRLNIVDPDLVKFKIEIIPFIDFKDNQELKDKLKREHNFKENLFVGQIVSLSEEDLENENLLWNKLLVLDKLLSELGAVKIDLDDYDLWE